MSCDLEKVSLLQKMIDQSSSIVFFGGAGVSTESGIPDFRSVDGLYNQKWDFPPEVILSHSFFMSNTAEFYRFYREKLIINGIKPNAAHLKLAELEKSGKLSCVITQNIDGLHQAAGSKNVFELHGSILRNFCMKCGVFYDLDFIANSVNADDKIPHCTKCGGTVKPDVVLYEEALDAQTMSGAIFALEKADLLIIGGTSLTVYPAAGLVNYFGGTKTVVINKDSTQEDSSATLVIRDSIGEVFSQISV